MVYTKTFQWRYNNVEKRTGCDFRMGLGSVAAKARVLGRGGASAESASACPGIVAMVAVVGAVVGEGTRGQTCTCSLLIRDPVRLESAAAGVAVVAVGRTNDDAATAPL